MSEITSRPPPRLLLATDLSARCDRALDRAVQLSREWRAELLVVTVLETPARPDPLAVPTWPPFTDDEGRRRLAQRQLERDAGSLPVPAQARVVRGDAARAIADTAVAADCGLILTGMARNELLGRILVGSTVEQLARTVAQPILVVRERVRGRYRRVLVATDFSEASRHALATAVRLFADRDLIVYHARALPASGSSAATLAEARQVDVSECAAFLAGSALDPAVRERLKVVIESEAPEIGLSRYVREHDVDLVVLGTQGRTGLMNVLLGSVATQLLRWMPCDTLVVRQPRA